MLEVGIRVLLIHGGWRTLPSEVRIKNFPGAALFASLAKGAAFDFSCPPLEGLSANKPTVGGWPTLSSEVRIKDFPGAALFASLAKGAAFDFSCPP